LWNPEDVMMVPAEVLWSPVAAASFGHATCMLDLTKSTQPHQRHHGLLAFRTQKCEFHVNIHGKALLGGMLP
jgi:hypothetical protein